MTKAIRWTQEMLDAFEAKKAAIRAAQQPVAKPKPAKYRNKKCEYNGIKFDSEKEMKRWQQLEILAAAGYIKDLKRQVAYVLAPAVRIEGQKRKKPALRYVCDFQYVDNGQVIVEDCKSEITRKLQSYRQKLHLMKSVHNISIREV